MNPAIKATLVIISTFAIGVAVGAVLDATIARDRVEQVRGFRGGRDFGAPLERVIRPRDEGQAEAIREVLERASAENREIFERTRQEMRNAMDELMAELDPLLDDEQRARLRRFGEPRGDWDGRGRGRGSRRERSDASEDARPRDRGPRPAGSG